MEVNMSKSKLPAQSTEKIIILLQLSVKHPCAEFYKIWFHFILFSYKLITTSSILCHQRLDKSSTIFLTSVDSSMQYHVKLQSPGIGNLKALDTMGYAARF
jgi:16S rRNA G1207 methylase RsmC